MSTADRRGMLDRDDPNLSVRAQCAMLGLSRSGVYRQRAANDDDDLALMRRIDKLFLQHPFLGSRRMAQMLSTPRAPVNRKRVQRLMRLMGIAALGPRKNTSKPAPEHKIFPYLLRYDHRPGQPGLGGGHHLQCASSRMHMTGMH